MAKKDKEKVVLENIELKPQVIGTVYKKKNNLFRVIIIFCVFGLAIYYINEISVFFNDLFGKTTASTIIEGTENKSNSKNNDDDTTNEIVYNVYSSDLTINEDVLTIDNFSYVDGRLTFDITNTSGSSIDWSSKKYFIETYSENKTLLDRFKVDIGTIGSENKVSYSFNTENSFYYIVLEEKTVDDYPAVTLEDNDEGKGTITCSNGIETLVYTFINDELTEITDTISETDIENYNNNNNNNYSAYQAKATNYNNLSGITASFSSTSSDTSTGYIAMFNIILAEVNLENIDEPYYFSYAVEPKVVNFEMQTYGFTCS